MRLGRGRIGGGNHGPLGQKVLFLGLARDDFHDEVQVAEVPGVLLEQVEQDPLQGGRVGAIPAVARLSLFAERS